jgi:hypothetical protein
VGRLVEQLVELVESERRSDRCNFWKASGRWRSWVADLMDRVVDARADAVA